MIIPVVYLQQHLGLNQLSFQRMKRYQDQSSINPALFSIQLTVFGSIKLVYVRVVHNHSQTLRAYDLSYIVNRASLKKLYSNLCIVQGA